DHSSLEDLKERLLAAGFGVPATLHVVGRAQDAMRPGKARGGKGRGKALSTRVNDTPARARLAELEAAERGTPGSPIVRVSGVGETTSVAKLAHFLVKGGKKVLVAAADTFRAGAVAQLEPWASRIGADFLRGQQGGDPAAVAFDAMGAA